MSQASDPKRIFLTTYLCMVKARADQGLELEPLLSTDDETTRLWHLLSVEDQKVLAPLLETMSLKFQKLDQYQYHAKWSAEDSCFIGLCPDFPSLSHCAETRFEALDGIHRLVVDVTGDVITEETLKELAGDSLP